MNHRQSSSELGSCVSFEKLPVRGCRLVLCSCRFLTSHVYNMPFPETAAGFDNSWQNGEDGSFKKELSLHLVGLAVDMTLQKYLSLNIGLWKLSC